MKKVILTGGTGYIGQHLISFLSKEYSFIVLTRSPEKYRSSNTIRYEYWDGKSSIESFLPNTYAIINLIGENIGLKYWSKKQKLKIIESRVSAAEAIRRTLEDSLHHPQLWIQASATGYYGQLGSMGEISDEGSLKGENSFLADVCEAWEKPIHLAKTTARKVIVRTGVVLSPDSLLMKQICIPFYFGIGVVAGPGDNYLPWIALEDELEAIRFLLNKTYTSGVYNLVAPCNTTMRNLVRELRRYRFCFFTMKLPRWFLEVVLGKEKTKEIILTNQRVVPKRLMSAGFVFKCNKIAEFIQQNYERS